MPPNKKLSAAVIADFERRVRDGAIFPDNVPPVQPANSQRRHSSRRHIDPAGKCTDVCGRSRGGRKHATNPEMSRSRCVSGHAVAPVAADDSPISARSPRLRTAQATAAANPTPVPAQTPASAADPLQQLLRALLPRLIPPARTRRPPIAAAAPATKAIAIFTAAGRRPPSNRARSEIRRDRTSPGFPGTWIFRHGRFLWLAGQWSPVHRGWVWVPARYVLTPAGYSSLTAILTTNLRDAACCLRQ